MDVPFCSWAELYDESVGDLSRNTWSTGILQSLQDLEVVDGEILDVASGTGIGAEMLRSKGNFQIDALDNCGEMMEKAKGNYRQSFKECMEEISRSVVDKKYDAVVSAFDSVNYLNQTGMFSFLQNVATVLKPKGVLIFDYSSPNFLKLVWGNRDDEQQVTGGKLKWKHRFLSEWGGTVTSISFWSNDKIVWQENHVQYAWEYSLIARMGESVGLRLDHIRDIKRKTFDPIANTHVFVFKKG